MKFFCLLFALACSTAMAAPVPIFDGKTLEGWDYDPKIWRVEDGMITGGSTTEKITANYFISTKRSYQNFELRMKIRCSGDPSTGMINSGIQIRSVRVPGGTHMSGYQVDCGAGWFGKIYDEFRRNKVIATPVDQAALDKAVDVFGWNEYRIRAEGPRIRAWINGVLALDYTEIDPNIALDGQIGPQVHSGGVCLVRVKDVTVDELPPTPGAPTWESLGGIEAARKLVAPPPKKADVAPAKRDISYNAVQGTAKTAAEQQKLFHLPEGYEIELVVQESEGIGKFVSVYFDQRGRMWTQTAFEYPVDGNENPVAADALYQSRAKDKVLVYPREALNAPLPPGGLGNPTIFADGLAIPLGILPWGNGDTCYIQHGHDLKLFKDTNGDGRADTSDVILTGLGVQDSHLFPHQFTRAPGGWIWMAQGLFNNSKAQRPGSGKTVDWPKCSMAKMRPDGSQFEVTSVGPNNIWGLVITAEGEAFIQEANDYGYPVMPFHEYAYYPGGMEALRKSYQPEFPPQAEFRMGGTGLSGLALGEGAFRKLTPKLKDDGLCMIVANPITSKVQTLAMHREGPYWKLEQAPDLITCDDPFFRPVALTNGPDGCIYLVDWYNKIISHNEVPRNHPDRDKTRGRIWRVKPKGAKPVEIPDFTKLNGDELIAKLGGESLTQSHLAWQALADRGEPEEKIEAAMEPIIRDRNASAARRIQAQWVLEELNIQNPDNQISMAKDSNANVRREAIRSASVALQWAIYEVAHEWGFKHLAKDPDPSVRAELIRKLGSYFDQESGNDQLAIRLLLSMALEPLAEPVAPSSRNGKPTKVREAYDREFERYLVRSLVEWQLQRPSPHQAGEPSTSEQFLGVLDSPVGQALPLEARLLASLALEPKASATRVARLLPQLQRAPGQEEVLRLAEFPDEPGVGEALKAILANPATRSSTLDALLAVRTRLDAAKLGPFLSGAAATLLARGGAVDVMEGIRLGSSFRLRETEPALAEIASGQRKIETGSSTVTPDVVQMAALQALTELGSSQSELFSKLAGSAPNAAVRDAALVALASSPAPDAPAKVLALYPQLTAAQRQKTLDRLSTTKAGAAALVAALEAKTIPATDLDGPTLDRLQAVLGATNPALIKLIDSLGALFRPVLTLDGTDDAWVQTDLSFDGPLTVETWVRLAPGTGNADGILGVPGKLDINFYDSKLRVYVGGTLHDVIVAKKPVMPDLWTHVAAVRDACGRWSIYIDGELEPVQAKAPAPGPLEKVRIGWTSGKGGTQGAFAEYRLWNRARTAGEIRYDFDRALEVTKPNPELKGGVGNGLSFNVGLVFRGGDTKGWGQLQKGASIAKTSDLPPILTSEQAETLDSKFSKYRALAAQPGDVARGKQAAMICATCHVFGKEGGNIGPVLSGVGAMGTEAILRNILTPNAAMENGYRIFRVEKTDGSIGEAFFVSEDKNAVVIRLPGAADQRIERKDIRSTKYLRRSLMPEGLLDTMTDQQATDLFAYLLSLK